MDDNRMCVVCGTAIPPGTRMSLINQPLNTCSPACREQRQLDLRVVSQKHSAKQHRMARAKSRAVRDALEITPTGPTEAMPGTDEKILVLAARFYRKEKMWNELDAKPDERLE